MVAKAVMDFAENHPDKSLGVVAFNINQSDLIEKKIKEHFYSEDLLMFATPISHINEEFGALLREKIKSI